MATRKILVIEDDPAIRAGIQEGLEREFFTVVTAADGETGLQLALGGGHDVILLDLMLPERSGEEVCAEVRRNRISTPIIMLTAKAEEVDRVVGLEIGADDYMTKPFSLRELIARIRAVTRRGREIDFEQERYTFGDVTIDFKRQEGTKGSSAIKLSATEIKMLKFFVEHEGEVITRDRFLDEVWGYDSYPTTRTVDNFILGLRKKIEIDPSQPAHLLTVHRVGYKFVREPAASSDVVTSTEGPDARNGEEDFGTR